MSNAEWLRASEVAKIMRCSPSTISERARNRTRPDAIPFHLISGSGHAMRIHRSVAYPAPTPLPTRLTEADKDEIAQRVIAFMWESVAALAKGRSAA